MKKKTKKQIELTKREKILWLKVRAINPETLHKYGPNSMELFAIIHKASQKDYIYPFSEEMMCELIIGAYKNNLNLKRNKEGLDDFIIASLEFLSVYSSKTALTNYYNLIRKLTKIFEESIK